MRRRDTRKILQKPEDCENIKSSKSGLDILNNFKLIVLKVEIIGNGSTLSERLLGLTLKLSGVDNIVVANIIPDGPAHKCKDIAIGIN